MSRRGRTHHAQGGETGTHARRNRSASQTTEARVGSGKGKGPGGRRTHSSVPAFRWHGNYGGPGWTGGRYTGGEDRDSDYLVAPRDDLDQVFREHDLAYRSESGRAAADRTAALAAWHVGGWKGKVSALGLNAQALARDAFDSFGSANRFVSYERTRPSDERSGLERPSESEASKARGHARSSSAHQEMSYGNKIQLSTDKRVVFRQIPQAIFANDCALSFASTPIAPGGGPTTELMTYAISLASLAGTPGDYSITSKNSKEFYVSQPGYARIATVFRGNCVPTASTPALADNALQVITLQVLRDGTPYADLLSVLGSYYYVTGVGYMLEQWESAMDGIAYLPAHFPGDGHEYTLAFSLYTTNTSAIATTQVNAVFRQPHH